MLEFETLSYLVSFTEQKNNMFLLSLLSFGDSAQVTVLGSVGETRKSIPALCRSINANSVTEVPASGLYIADIQENNWTAVEPCTRLEFKKDFEGLFDGSKFKFEDYNSSLSTGRGTAPKMKIVKSPAQIREENAAKAMAIRQANEATNQVEFEAAEAAEA